MATIYRTVLLGNGTARNPYRAAEMDGITYLTLMIGETRAGVIVLAAGSGVHGAAQEILSAPTLTALKQLANTTSPTQQERAALNGWATANGLDTFSAEMNWRQAINFLCNQVNPGIDMMDVFLYEGAS